MWRQHQRLRRLWAIVPKSGLCGWLIQCDLLLTAGISTLSRFQRRLLPRSLCLSGLPRWCKEGAQLWCTQCTLPWCKTQCTPARCTPPRCKTAQCTTSDAHQSPYHSAHAHQGVLLMVHFAYRPWQSLAEFGIAKDVAERVLGALIHSDRTRRFQRNYALNGNS